MYWRLQPYVAEAATLCIRAAAGLLKEAAERHVLVAAQLDARLAQRHRVFDEAARLPTARGGLGSVVRGDRPRPGSYKPL